MGQKHRKSYVIQTFGIPSDLQERMKLAVAEQQRNTRFERLNTSSWICRAIERELSHVKRSRRRRLATIQQFEQVNLS